MPDAHSLTLPIVRALEAAGLHAYNVTQVGETTVSVDVEGFTLTLAVTRVEETPDRRSKFAIVLDDAAAQARVQGVYQDGDENLLALEATAFMHMAMDAGRPSDAARTTARAYLRDPEGFRQTFSSAREKSPYYA